MAQLRDAGVVTGSRAPGERQELLDRIQGVTAVPTLSFEGETHEDIVRQVRRWLVSTEGPEGHLGMFEAVERSAELTKDALSVIAAAAPAPIGDSDVVQGLTRMGYEATDQTKRAVLAGLSAVSELSGERLFHRIEGAGRAATYEMGSVVARQLLKTLNGGRHRP